MGIYNYYYIYIYIYVCLASAHAQDNNYYLYLQWVAMYTAKVCNLREATVMRISSYFYTCTYERV